MLDKRNKIIPTHSYQATQMGKKCQDRNFNALPIFGYIVSWKEKMKITFELYITWLLMCQGES